jgi:hypothetical protein
MEDTPTLRHRTSTPVDARAGAAPCKRARHIVIARDRMRLCGSGNTTRASFVVHVDLVVIP